MAEKYNEIIAIILIGSFFILFLAVIVIFAIIKYARRQQKHKQEKQFLHSQFQQELLQTQLEIQEQTLKTISQEIHDNVGQVLSLAKLNLNTFEDTESAYNQTKINDTKQLVSKAINDLRDLSRSLYGDKITELGLPVAIDNELRILKNIGQYQTELKVTGDSYKLQEKEEIVLFRIVQESLNNIVKHAKAKAIHVQTIYRPDIFTLTITDDGIGFDTGALLASQTGIGLKSIQNRIALIGGKFSLHSIPGEGTTVTIELKNPVNNLTA
jgi:two-component system NarL family sensor kinase